MATEPTTQVNLSKDTAMAVLEYSRKTNELVNQTWSLRPKLEEIDRYYLREGDLTKEQQRAKLANRLGDKTRLQNAQVPIIMPQVESALGYLTNVFLTGYPLFGVGAPPQAADAALMMESIIGENSIRGGWVDQLMMWFRDGLKYNLHALEVNWDRQTTYTFDTDINFSPTVGKPKEVIWQGNCLRRMDMYNTVFDTRVAPTEVHKRGDFAGYIDVMTRMELKTYINSLFGQVPAKTAIEAFQSASITAPYSGAPMSYYIPSVNPDALLQKQTAVGTFDWMSWAFPNAKSGVQYKNIYQVFKLYARILPSDFGIRTPAENTPQIYKFVIINNQVVLFAERMTNAHNYLPIIIGQPVNDGLQFQTKSLAQNGMPFQDMATAMWAADLASKRRLVTDRALYDPSRVREADINSDNPSAKIPVRPSAYGKPVAESIHIWPFRDEQAGTLIAQSDMIVKMANTANGQNASSQGQFTKGNKTLHEYQDVVGHSNNRNQLIATTIEHQSFVAVKEIIKINILQYQPPGEVYNPEVQASVKIDPQALRQGIMMFKISDGLMPKDKIMNADEFQATLQLFGSSPSIAAGYNVGPMFSYIMKQRGADLSPFEKPPEQVQYEQALRAWQTAAEAYSKRVDMSPEAIQKVLGPMPQPPQTKQSQAAVAQQAATSPTATLSQMNATAPATA